MCAQSIQRPWREKEPTSGAAGALAAELGLPLWVDMDLFTYLESYGAVSVMETVYQLDEYVDVDPYGDPLRALAKKWLYGYDGGGSGGTMIR